MHLALTGLFRARWTDRIHEEWITNLLEKRPDLTREQLDRTKNLMNAHVLDCLVTGYEALVGALELPDRGDRHVLAAAIRAGADLIVTCNTDDFPVACLEPYGIETQHPDDCLTHLLDLSPGAVCGAAKRHRESLRKPPKSVEEHLDILARQQLPQTVGRFREFAQLL